MRKIIPLCLTLEKFYQTYFLLSLFITLSPFTSQSTFAADSQECSTGAPSVLDPAAQRGRQYSQVIAGAANLSPKNLLSLFNSLKASKGPEGCRGTLDLTKLVWGYRRNGGWQAEEPTPKKMIAILELLVGETKLPLENPNSESERTLRDKEQKKLEPFQKQCKDSTKAIVLPKEIASLEGELSPFLTYLRDLFPNLELIDFPKEVDLETANLPPGFVPDLTEDSSRPGNAKTLLVAGNAEALKKAGDRIIDTAHSIKSSVAAEVSNASENLKEAHQKAEEVDTKKKADTSERLKDTVESASFAAKTEGEIRNLEAQIIQNLKSMKQAIRTALQVKKGLARFPGSQRQVETYNDRIDKLKAALNETTTQLGEAKKHRAEIEKLAEEQADKAKNLAAKQADRADSARSALSLARWKVVKSLKLGSLDPVLHAEYQAKVDEYGKERNAEIRAQTVRSYIEGHGGRADPEGRYNSPDGVHEPVQRLQEHLEREQADFTAELNSLNKCGKLKCERATQKDDELYGYFQFLVRTGTLVIKKPAPKPYMAKQPQDVGIIKSTIKFASQLNNPKQVKKMLKMLLGQMADSDGTHTNPAENNPTNEGRRDLTRFDMSRMATPLFLKSDFYKDVRELVSLAREAFPNLPFVVLPKLDIRQLQLPADLKAVIQKTSNGLTVVAFTDRQKPREERKSSVGAASATGRKASESWEDAPRGYSGPDEEPPLAAASLDTREPQRKGSSSTTSLSESTPDQPSPVRSRSLSSSKLMSVSTDSKSPQPQVQPKPRLDAQGNELLASENKKASPAGAIATSNNPALSAYAAAIIGAARSNSQRHKSNSVQSSSLDERTEERLSDAREALSSAISQEGQLENETKMLQKFANLNNFVKSAKSVDDLRPANGNTAKTLIDDLLEFTRARLEDAKLLKKKDEDMLEKKIAAAKRHNVDARTAEELVYDTLLARAEVDAKFNDAQKHLDHFKTLIDEYKALSPKTLTSFKASVDHTLRIFASSGEMNVWGLLRTAKKAKANSTELLEDQAIARTENIAKELRENIALSDEAIAKAKSIQRQRNEIFNPQGKSKTSPKPHSAN